MVRQPEHLDRQTMAHLTRELGLASTDLATPHDGEPKERRRMPDDRGIPAVCHTFTATLNAPDAADRSVLPRDAKRMEKRR